MTHVTFFGLWVLWLSSSLGVSFHEARMRWPEGAQSGWPCGNPRSEEILWSEDLLDGNPTCPHCAVLCDMARGAE